MYVENLCSAEAEAERQRQEKIESQPLSKLKRQIDATVGQRLMAELAIE